LRGLGAVLGLVQQDADGFLKKSVGDQTLSDNDIETMLGARRDARTAKNFAESDRIRAVLSAAGVLLEDKPAGVTEWRRA
jgi:cysteinyl-tRNA synthetase